MPGIVVPKVRVELTRGCHDRFLSPIPRVLIRFPGVVGFQISAYNSLVRSSASGQSWEVQPLFRADDG